MILLTATSAIAAAPERAFVPPLLAGDVVPDVPLVDQLGRRFSLDRDGRVDVVSFAYTRCPDPAMCALVTTKFALLERDLAVTNVRLVEITLDPEHDRPSVLRVYASAVGAKSSRWLFGTGEARAIGALAQRFGIVNERVAAGYRHTEAVAILSETGVVQEIVAGNGWRPEDVAAQARATAGLASNPLQRFALRVLAGASALCGSGGAGGFSLAASFAVFIALAVAFGWIALRVFAAALAGGS